MKARLTLGPLQPFIVLLLPQGLQVLSPDNLPALEDVDKMWTIVDRMIPTETYAFVQLSPVLVGPGVCPPLVFGVHADLGLLIEMV